LILINCYEEKTKYAIIASLIALLSSIACFIWGFYTGQRVARLGIKSELIWHNQYLLKGAVEDIKQGRTSEAEKKINYVNEELEKMKSGR